MKKLITLLTPPDQWKFPVIIVLGIFFGLGVYSFHISRAPSYLSDKPETCINCHIMAPEYSTWNHSAHREYTNCNDCHVPHNNLASHYFFKAMDGLRHATVFTLRGEPQVIKIKEAGTKAVHNNCIRCHEDVIVDSKLMRPEYSHNQLRKERKCWECHRETPHGKVKGLSSTPN
nr:cytochrome c nitrite reductase small subunit [Tenuifilaceae bacterium]